MTYALALSDGATVARVPSANVRSQEYAGGRKNGSPRVSGVAAKVSPETMPELAHKATWW